MIFAVDVVSDGPAEGHEFRPRRDWQEPALRHSDPQQRVECQACFGADYTGRPVGLDYSIERDCAYQFTVAIEADVAVRARSTKREGRPVATCEGGVGVAQKSGCID